METEHYEQPESYRFHEEGMAPDQLDPEKKTKLIKITFILTYVWLGLHIWMIILGAIVMSMYSTKIKNNSWWSM